MNSQQIMSIGFESFRVDAIIGVYPEEQHNPQELLIDLLAEYDAKNAIEKDSEDAALDYTALAEAVRSTAVQGRFGLIEALAHGAARRLLEEFSEILQVELTIRKPRGLPGARNSLVTYKLRRYNEPSTG